MQLVIKNGCDQALYGHCPHSKDACPVEGMGNSRAQPVCSVTSPYETSRYWIGEASRQLTSGRFLEGGGAPEEPMQALYLSPMRKCFHEFSESLKQMNQSQRAYEEHDSLPVRNMQQPGACDWHLLWEELSLPSIAWPLPSRQRVSDLN